MKPWSITLLALAMLTTAVAADDGWHVVRTIPVEGEGGWDYLTLDAAGQRLFISRGTHVQVLDVASGQLAGDIPDTSGVHGIALDPGSGHGFTSNGKSDSVTMFNLDTLAVEKQIPVAKKPDAIINDLGDHRIVVMCGQGDSMTFIDPSSGRVVGNVPLGGGPEFAADDGDGHIFVNLEDESQVVEVDVGRLKVLGQWSLTPGQHPTGMAVDRRHHRLYIGCANKTMVVFDTKKHTIVDTVPIGQGVDATRYDAGLHLAFSSNGEGSLTVVDARSDKVVQTVQTEPGARTMELDDVHHVVYTCTAHVTHMPTPQERAAGQRPQYAPNTFHVLVLQR